jgi:hypothetical protein
MLGARYEVFACKGKGVLNTLLFWFQVKCCLRCPSFKLFAVKVYLFGVFITDSTPAPCLPPICTCFSPHHYSEVGEVLDAR